MNGVRRMSEEEEIRVVLPRQWREASEDKLEYVIKILDFDEEAKIITKLRLSRIYRPLGSKVANRIELNYDISIEGSEITVTVSEVRCSWGGTGEKTLARISVREGYVEEDPWFIDPWEIDDMVRRLGVAKTSELIIDAIKSVINYYLDWEE
jgi:hypothetical protein